VKAKPVSRKPASITGKMELVELKNIHCQAAHGAAANYIAQQNRQSVATQVSTQLAKDKEQNKKRLLTELNAIIFLMRQGFSLRRGKDETNDNLHQLLQLLARS